VRLLLTGANGQAGWELRRSLLPLGEVIALDRAQCDLTRPADVPRILRDAKPAIIINAAAYTAVDMAEDEEPLATLVNGTAVGAIAETARQIGALLVHYSTDYVFDGSKDTPYTEDDPPHPINAYGRSKLAGERAVEQCGGRFLILRTSWIYAARGRNFLRTILRLARERDELRIVNDQIGTPTWARDLADATASIARQAQQELEKSDFRSGLFHLTAAGATSWFGFAQAIIEQAAAQSNMLPRRPRVLPISSAQYSTRAARPQNSRLAGERVRARFGIALPDWREALRRCMAEVAHHTVA
jgi:dTDP-4-dehydrorhamnose reductase